MRQTAFLLALLLILACSLSACENEASDPLPGDGDVLDGDEDGDEDENGDGDGEEADGDGDEDGDEDENGDGDADEDGDEEEDAEEDTPRVEEFLAMTFNLRTATASDGVNAWDNRKAQVAALIARQLPAIMGVQETWKFQNDHIKNEVDGYEWVGRSRADLEGYDEYCAIFFRTDRFTLLDSDTFWVSDTPDVPGSTFVEEQNYPRIVTWAKLESVQTGRVLFVFNTHLDTRADDEIPERSAALLVRKVDAIAGDSPVLAMGDFNQHVGSNAYRILTGDMEYQGQRGRFIDPWVVLDLPDGGTYHGFTGVPTRTSRIDWILATEDFAPLSGEILRDNEEGLFPSDHFPVTTAFSWGE